MPASPLTDQYAWPRRLRAAYQSGCLLLPAELQQPEPVFGAPDAGPRANELKRTLSTKSPPPSRTVQQTINDLQWRGFAIPQRWLSESLHEYAPIINDLAALHAHFPLANYLSTILQRLRDTTLQPIPALYAQYHFIPAYLRLLRRGSGKARVLPRSQTPHALRHRLHVGQIQEITLMAVRVTLGGYESKADLYHFIATAGASVQQLFEQHLKQFLKATAHALHPSKHPPSTSLSLLPASPLSSFEKDYYACCRHDLDTLRLRVLFESDNLTQLPENLRAALHTSPNPQPPTLFERIANYQPGPTANSPNPLETPTAHTCLSYLDPATRTRLLEHSPAPETLHQTYAQHLATSLNPLTHPLIEWEAEDGHLLPNLTRGQAHHPTISPFVAKRNLELEELQLLATRRALFQSATTLKTLDRLAAESTFNSPEVNSYLATAINTRREELRKIERFRQLKLKEYGLDSTNLSEVNLSVILDEIIQIEREVLPFIAYVQSAFHSVLPISSRLAFDSNRHSSDGPEFDPDTLTDPHKYLRGEVMKTFRRLKGDIEISQVNMFCLDFSKSMTHQPMRNLFKLMFLLILGLEGRGTHDAVSFFGARFIEVVNFGFGVTSRKMLWPIMRQISAVENQRVVYQGNGFTNISGGLDESHRRLNEYADYLQEKNPDLHLVRSIFMLTDGEPNAGIFMPQKLHKHIEGKRQDGPVAIKGIYLDTGDRVGDTIAAIFGPQHSVQASDFESVVINFVQIMTKTYKSQRTGRRRATIENRKADTP